LALGASVFWLATPAIRTIWPQFGQNRFAPLYGLLESLPGASGLVALLLSSALVIGWSVSYSVLLKRLLANPSVAQTLFQQPWHWGLLGTIWVALALAFPLLSDDVLAYVVRARQLWEAGANPYQGGLAAVTSASDWTALIGPSQQDQFSYGPLTLLFSLPAVILAGDSLPLALVIYRLLHLLALGGCLLGIWRALRTDPQRWALLLAVLWHPLLLLEGVWSAHNDLLMLLGVVWALTAMRTGRIAVAAWCLTAGVLIKYIPVLLGPLLVVAAWKHLGASRAGWGRLLRVAGLAIVGSLLLLLVSYAPFVGGVGLDVLTGALTAATKLNPSFGAVLVTYLGPLVGEPFVLAGLRVVLLLLLLWATWQVWRGAALAEQAVLVLLGLVAIVTTWLVPWYGLWFVLLAPFVRAKLQSALLGVTTLFLAYYLLNALPFPGWMLGLLFSLVPLLVVGRAWRQLQVP
jgi:hypothetical protein